MHVVNIPWSFVHSRAWLIDCHCVTLLLLSQLLLSFWSLSHKQQPPVEAEPHHIKVQPSLLHPGAQLASPADQSAVQMPVFRAIKHWMVGQPAASPGLLYNLLMMVRLEHLQGDALHLLLQDELVRGDVQCSQLVAHAALQIAGTATDHFPCRPVRSLAAVQVQVGTWCTCVLQVSFCTDGCVGSGMNIW